MAPQRDEAAEERGDGLAAGTDRLGELLVGEPEANLAALRGAIEERVGEAAGDGFGDEVHEGALHPREGGRP